MALSKVETSAIIKEFGKNEKDTGSTEVQIALLTARIKELTAHLQANKQDAGAHRALLILVGKRRSLLDYLRQSDAERYTALIAKLGLRK
ncbi:MAG: 30S ribosomal protein S15 [Candidatus Enteromonas sp.]|nr:30S ribosomal protein S15 [Candidatus Enteromonas sp.]